MSLDILRLEVPDDEGTVWRLDGVQLWSMSIGFSTMDVVVDRPLPVTPIAPEVHEVVREDRSDEVCHIELTLGAARILGWTQSWRTLCRRQVPAEPPCCRDAPPCGRPPCPDCVAVASEFGIPR